jgi:hypothetical protein
MQIFSIDALPIGKYIYVGAPNNRLDKRRENGDREGEEKTVQVRRREKTYCFSRDGTVLSIIISFNSPCLGCFFGVTENRFLFELFLSLGCKRSKQRVTEKIVYRVCVCVCLFFVADCELLFLYKQEFDEILKSTLEAKHENITSALRRFEYFNNYTDAKVRRRRLNVSREWD